MESLGDEALPHISNRLNTASVGVGYFGIRPARTVRICLEKDLRAPHLLGSARKFLNNGLELLALIVAQADNVFLLHAPNLEGRMAGAIS